MFTRFLRGLVLTFLISSSATAAEVTTNAGLRLARFDVDATPPVGSHLAYDPVTNAWDMTLVARGVVLLGVGQPIVLCAVDWIGIANEGHDAFRIATATAAGTVPRCGSCSGQNREPASNSHFSPDRGCV